jgi:hypothetical protein
MNSRVHTLYLLLPTSLSSRIALPARLFATTGFRLPSCALGWAILRTNPPMRSEYTLKHGPSRTCIFRHSANRAPLERSRRQRPSRRFCRRWSPSQLRYRGRHVLKATRRFQDGVGSLDTLYALFFAFFAFFGPTCLPPHQFVPVLLHLSSNESPHLHPTSLGLRHGSCGPQKRPLGTISAW